ncbi:hypothetical protein GCM10009087_02150 [Sphingomonas oligophenolica]|uniref:DUF3325 domain-containing protein n=1 Tax=Sphingomonas oligophenolica TaxID=301154 RepID=A0ABU9Y0U3_9SPHN
MSTAEIIGAVLFVPALDWVGVTRVADYYSDFDYRYWPLERLRLISLFLLAAATITVGVFASPDDPPLWPLMLFVAAAAAWAIIALRDINAQRRTGYRNPPRYSERD